jgi:hypothetical protein
MMGRSDARVCANLPLMNTMRINWKLVVLAAAVGIVTFVSYLYVGFERMGRDLETVDFSAARDSRAIKGIQIELKVISWLVRSGLFSRRETDDSSVGSLLEQDVRIRVLDGRSGHPISDEHVQVWFNSIKGSSLDLPTDKDGYAALSLSQGVESLFIFTDHYYDCRPFRKNAPKPSYAVAEIRKTGVVVENDCSKFTTEPKRDELTLFVRPLHWWESFRR